MNNPKAVADTEIGIVLATADVTALPKRVFKALTEHKEIEHWWGDDNTYHMRDWLADFRVGGSYTVNVQNADGTIRPASGKFLEIDFPVKLVHTRKYLWEFPVLGMRETTITYRFEPIAAGTRITVRHEGFEGCSEAAYNHAAGWERVLHWLGDYLK
jgi:uncharacterized protein YndB with AHSA1/START domain